MIAASAYNARRTKKSDPIIKPEDFFKPETGSVTIRSAAEINAMFAQLDAQIKTQPKRKRR